MSAALQTFLYVLMRDHLPIGVVNGIIADHIRPGVRPLFSDKDLAAIAERVATELTTPQGGA